MDGMGHFEKQLSVPFRVWGSILKTHQKAPYEKTCRKTGRFFEFHYVAKLHCRVKTKGHLKGWSESVELMAPPQENEDNDIYVRYADIF